MVKIQRRYWLDVKIRFFRLNSIGNDVIVIQVYGLVVVLHRWLFLSKDGSKQQLIRSQFGIKDVIQSWAQLNSKFISKELIIDIHFCLFFFSMTFINKNEIQHLKIVFTYICIIKDKLNTSKHTRIYIYIVNRKKKTLVSLAFVLLSSMIVWILMIDQTR